MQKTPAIIFVLLAEKATALPDSFGMRDATKFLTKTAGVYSLGAVDSADLILPLLLAIFLLVVIVLALIWITKKH